MNRKKIKNNNETNEFERKRLLKIHFLVGLNACSTICIRFVEYSLNQFFSLSYECLHMGANDDV